MRPLVVFTIGHSTRALDGFIRPQSARRTTRHRRAHDPSVAAQSPAAELRHSPSQSPPTYPNVATSSAWMITTFCVISIDVLAERCGIARPRANGPPPRATTAEAACAAAPGVGAATPAPRAGARRANAPILGGSEGARGARTSSPSSVSTIGRNINGSNRNGVFSRDSRDLECS